MSDKNILPCFVVLCAVSIFLPAHSFALPWDIDMYRQESLKSNEVARSPVPGTVPVGYKPFTMSLEDADTQLKNPQPRTQQSAWHGQRLWATNCSPCHGVRADGKTSVGPKMGVPDLLADLYRNKSDGHIFGVIHYGLRNMPRYGFKLSEEETWDLINYLRFLEGADVPGMTRPGK